MFVLFGRPPGGPGPYWHGPPPWHRPPRPPPWHGEVDEVIVEHMGPSRPQPTVVQVAHHPGHMRPLISEQPLMVPVAVNPAQPSMVQPIYSTPLQSVQPVQTLQSIPTALQPVQQSYIPQSYQPNLSQLGLPTAPLNQLSPQNPVIPMPHSGIQPLGQSPPPSPIYPRQ